MTQPSPSNQLAELGITLPSPAAPVGSYIPAIRTGNYAMCSGQLALNAGKLIHEGKVPNTVSLEDAQKDAEVAAINGIAAIAQVAGGIDNIAQIVRVCVYVASDPGFTAQPTVANGASDMLAKIFGEKGRHARAAVGVAELPLGASVEVEILAEIK
jgi:enamine deaminase RidA (YjgF/YER057c/UK114 family)